VLVKTVKDDGLVSMALRHKKWYSLSLSHTEIVSFHFVTRLLIEKKKKSLFHQKEKRNIPRIQDNFLSKPSLQLSTLSFIFVLLDAVRKLLFG